jgi:hypothetical protein
MLMRHLITAVLMLLSLGAQASTTVFGCGPSGLGTSACCDPHTQIHRCPSRGLARLSCDQACPTDGVGAVAVTVERDQQTPPLDPMDGFAALATHFYELLASADFLERALPPVERPAARYPSNPTYLATARLRL